MLTALILAVFPACMLLACYTDATSMTIPNKIILVCLAGFAIVTLITGMEFSQIGWHIGVGVAVLAAGFGLFSINAIGGGDAKLMAVTALWLGPQDLSAYLIAAAVLGGVLTLILILFRSWPMPVSLIQVGWVGRLHSKNLGVPYGVALGPAGIYAFLESGWMNHVAAGAAIFG